jgi:serine protease
MRLWIALTGLSLAVAGATVVSAAEYNPARKRPAAAKETEVQRVIVKLRPNSGLQIQDARNQVSVDALAAANVKRLQSVASRHGLSMQESRAISADMHVMFVKPAVAGDTIAQTLAALNADSSVEFAQADERRYLHAVPNDPLFAAQWYMQSAEASAVRATTAWDTQVGNTGVVIAELDTGVRFDHPDLLRASGGGRLLPGYDMISADSAGNFFTANDGNGRDTDPSDAGDWVTQANVDAPSNNCTEVGDSSWHGTRVAGILGALTNNSAGIAGLTWSPWILPVRVIGKCGGFNSDVLAGMRWAAGLAVPGVPANPYPADIINVSLGGDGPCQNLDQDTVDDVTAAGALLVVSAGNGVDSPAPGGGIEVSSPANCVGAAGIAGLRHVGTKVGFSNLGPQIALGAPGGNCVNTGPGQDCLFSIDTTTNIGATTATTNGYTDQQNFNVGTSFSAPIVAAIAGLMKSSNGNLSPAQLLSRLKEGASPFPNVGGVAMCQSPNSATPQLECNCTTATCGAGMANAEGALNAALRPIAAVNVVGSIGPGVTLTLQGSGSAASCNRTIASYQWTVVSPSVSPPPITDANMAQASINAPNAGTYTLRLTVTDNLGLTDSADLVLSTSAFTSSAPTQTAGNACPPLITVDQTSPGPTPNPNPPPTVPTTPTPGGGGGGGGAIDLLTILFNVVGVLVAALIPRRRGRSADFAQRARPASQGAQFVQRPRSRSAVSSQVFCARR